MRQLIAPVLVLAVASCASKPKSEPAPKKNYVSRTSVAPAIEGTRFSSTKAMLDRQLTPGETIQQDRIPVTQIHSRSKPLEKLSGGELQALLQRAQAANDLTTLSILVEESLNRERSDADIIPVLAALLDDTRPAALEDEDPVKVFLEDRTRDEVKLVPMPLNLYAIWHLQRRLGLTPGGVSLAISKESKLYYAQQGRFAVPSAPLITAWKKWWQDNRLDYEGQAKAAKP